MNSLRRVGMTPLRAILIVAASPLLAGVVAIAMSVLPR